MKDESVIVQLLRELVAGQKRIADLLQRILALLEQ